MAGFEVNLTKKALKNLNQLPRKIQDRVKRKLLILENNPFEQKKLGGDLEGLYSIRIWPYRAIYFVEKKTVWVVKIQHRQSVYR